MKYKAIILILFISLIFVNSANSETINIKFAHNFPDQSFFGMGAKIFKNLAEERLKGQVSIEVYPNSELGNNIRIREKLRISEIELALIINYRLTDFSKKFMVYGLPFIFEDFGTVIQFQNSEAGKSVIVQPYPGIKGLISIYFDIETESYQRGSSLTRSVSSNSRYKKLKRVTFLQPTCSCYG